MNPNNYNRTSHNLNAIKSDGTQITATEGATPAAFGVTLASSTTYYIPLGGDHTPVPSLSEIVGAQLRWDAAIIMTVTIETTLFPMFSPSDASSGIPDVSDVDAGNSWVLQNPTGVYIPTGPATGVSIANMTVTVAGGTASSCEFDLGNLGARRVRLKIVVGGTGGVVRCATWGKATA